MKKVGFVVLFFLFPLFVSVLFAGPAYLLDRGFLVSPLIYLGEIIGSLVMMYFLYRRFSFTNFGLTLSTNRSDAIWALLYLIMRIGIWIAFVPILGIESNLFFLLKQIFFFLCLNALAEELHFRGLLYSALKSIVFPNHIIIAVVISSALFALLHFSFGWFWFFLYVTDGMMFCALRIKSDNIFVPLLVHGLFNIMTGALLMGANTVSDMVAMFYVLTVILVDLTFFFFLMKSYIFAPKLNRDITVSKDILSEG